MTFSKILEVGVKSNLDFYTRREVRILNLFAIITVLGLLIGATNVIFLGKAYPALAEALVILSSASIIFLNYKEQYSAAAYMFVITLNASILFINQYYHESTGTYLFYFPLVFCVALLHNPQKSNIRTIIFFTIILAGFLCARLTKIPFLQGEQLSEEQNHILFIYNIYFCVILTIVLVFMVIKLINKQSSELMNSLTKEQTTQQVINQSLKEKEILLAEIQHRVKNNLAVITGLLNLQMEKAPCESSRNLMIDSRNRVMSIAMVHERLYRKDDLSKINFKNYLSELTAEVVKSFPVKTHQVEIEEDLEKVEVEVTKAVPVGLILNEAITNSLKHAFNEVTHQPVIRIQMKVIFDKIQISLSDNGIGFPPLKSFRDTSLGMSLIESLADQIDANVSFRNENGAYLNLVFRP